MVFLRLCRESIRWPYTYVFSIPRSSELPFPVPSPLPNCSSLPSQIRNVDCNPVLRIGFMEDSEEYHHEGVKVVHFPTILPKAAP